MRKNVADGMNWRKNRCTEPFKADKRKVIALAVELDETGKGLVDWKEVKA